MKPCPCGSQKPLSDCCLPYIEGTDDPPTAEALMRSRYTAYAIGNVPYIISTCHPSIVKKQDAVAIARWCDNAEFMRLQIMETKAGGAADEDGIVRFIAWVKEKGKLEPIHEKSTFKRHEGLWTYLSGQQLSVKMPGPNDPCPCGSGLKYKKCCGAD